jgi:hypothetical protein
MRVVAGHGGQPAVLVTQLIKEIETVAPIGRDRAGVIVDLDRMRRAERTAVLDRQLRPRRMGDGDKGARLPRPLRQPRSALVWRRMREIEREPGCDYMPIFSGARTHGVNFGADQGGETVGAELAGVGDGLIEPVEKMIRQLDKIVARAFIGLHNIHGVQGPSERDECA